MSDLVNQRAPDVRSKVRERVSIARSDRIMFWFADATAFSIEVAHGEGAGTIGLVVERKGAYESGWVQDATDPNVFFNLNAAVRMQLISDG